ncbi:MAG: hybrid sensor histidine kinase/response regulator [Proteobacteria bacterium]|nr:hybrid sensor histidine kinase/response regulator [Pseudomonadota bacterium]
MSNSLPEDLSSFSMLDLFKAEAETQLAVLSRGLLDLEKGATPEHLKELMRAAHSLKGAARLVSLDTAVRVAHVMEDALEAAQHSPVPLAQKPVAGLLDREDLSPKFRGQTAYTTLLVDMMLEGVDLLDRIAHTPEAEVEQWSSDHSTEVETYLRNVGVLMEVHAQAEKFAQAGGGGAVARGTPSGKPAPASVEELPGTGAGLTKEDADRSLRITADSLNRLLALAGESQLQAHRLRPFAGTLLRLKRQLTDLSTAFDHVRDAIPTEVVTGQLRDQLHTLQLCVADSRQFLGDRLVELENLGRGSSTLSGRMYDAALACRMRPFSDGIQGFPRMVRDLCKRLGKEATLVVLGEDTQVDRDILEKLEPLITQLLRNALDHGLEFPDDRVGKGKPRSGRLTLEARHSNGKLLVSVADDGRGVDNHRLRESVVSKGLTSRETAAQLSEQELLEFLFLPGFSTKESVSELSGRGVGLDIVLNTVKSVRGSVRVTSTLGEGTRFQLQLPLSLSVIRALLVSIAGEPYAVPLTAVSRTRKLARDEVETKEGRRFLVHEDRRLPLVTAHQVLDRGEPPVLEGDLPVIVLGEREQSIGLLVDRFIGERELVVLPLDPKLGKVQDIAAGALMEDGAPVLILDADDLLRSAERSLAVSAATGVRQELPATSARQRQRVLVVDDSLTVRELERKLLVERGYEVEVAVDGMDGWHAVRAGRFDLVITDMDMPRMDGSELTRLIKTDVLLRSLPVMMITYKEREEDRQRGLRAGVDVFLTKGSFQDATFLRKVGELIGEPA